MNLTSSLKGLKEISIKEIRVNLGGLMSEEKLKILVKITLKITIFWKIDNVKMILCSNQKS